MGGYLFGTIFVIPMKPKISPLGDSAILVQMGEEIDLQVNQRVHSLSGLVETFVVPGIVETVPAYTTLLVQYDPLVISYTHVREFLREQISQVDETANRKPRYIEVPVRYGGEYGIDLEEVARQLHLQVNDVIRIHSEKIYTVYMMGFNDALIMPRLETPRTHVPAGTVAIAGSQTGIYSITSPGGWRLIGWTPLQLFDPHSETPFLFAPGDEVKFIAESR